MNQIDHRRHRVAIAGRVVDAATGKPVSGADVKISEMPDAMKRRLEIAAAAYGTRWSAMGERQDRTQSRDDGIFFFLDLPNGDYELQVSLASAGNRFGVHKMPARVSRDGQGNVQFALLRCALPPTSVTGKVTAPGHEAGVPLARVRVKGSGERAFTDLQGQYVLAGIEPGKKRTLLVSAQGYGNAAKDFALPQPGSTKKIDFELTRENG